MSIQIMAALLMGVSLLAGALVVYFYVQAQKSEDAYREADRLRAIAESERNLKASESERTLARFKDITDADTEKNRVIRALKSERSQLQEENRQIKESNKKWIQEFNAQKERMESSWDKTRKVTEAEITSLRERMEALRTEFNALDEEANLQSFGFYKPHYDFASSAAYQSKLTRIRASQKKMIKDKTAAVGDIEWMVNGSAAEGRKQINQTLRLLLRAFNGECDAAIAKVRYNNIKTMETRIGKAQEAINKLADVQKCRITTEYLDLKMQELYLAHEYQEKVQAEKEEQRRIREEMREEAVAAKELERAMQEAEKEEERYTAALARARAEAASAAGAKQEKLQYQIAELERRLSEAHTNTERAKSRAEMTRSGYVYVISNIGSFGDEVYKIGMTRRLDPMDRVRELGDASVPFRFDVHAMIFSEDAPTLEAELHRRFHNKRVNLINHRREFFRVSLKEIADTVKRHHGEIEFVYEREAEEYRKTLSSLEEMQQLQAKSMGNRSLKNDFHPARSLGSKQ